VKFDYSANYMLTNHCLLISSKNFIPKLVEIIVAIKNVLDIFFSVQNEAELVIQWNKLRFEAEKGGLNIDYLKNKMNLSGKIKIIFAYNSYFII
jgi:hypothetical protein